MGFFKDILFAHGLPTDFFAGTVDIHSHILPGVDDGIANVESAIDALHEQSELGFKGVMLTPHIMTDYRHNNKAFLTESFEAFKSRMAKEKSIPELRLAGEYMLDDSFPTHMADGLLFLDNAEHHILVETSYVEKHPKYSRMIYDASLDGYYPIIAHPERYYYANMKVFNKWKDRGYKFQLNLLSITGYYGHDPEAKALFLLKEGMYDFAGTDLHKTGIISHKIRHTMLSTKNWERIHILMENNLKLWD